MAIRPIDIARKLNISTSSLRHYEDWGMIPKVERSASGYRIYTDEHVAYFECIRAMANGFGIWLIAEVLKKVMAKDVDSAFWLVNKAQSSLHNEKIICEKTMLSIEETSAPLLSQNDKREYLTINEISKETGIPVTTIRHWEKVGLITTPRNKENRYRLFNKNHILQILVIHALKTSLYSYPYSLDGIKKIIQELDYNNVEKVSKIANDFQKHLDQINRYQMRGVQYLYGLCEKLGLVK
ncbi:MAG: MerR family transcriptional regulator [Sporomusaceae bacterium]|nr:MerR family transcriptional regulator [Sporomusaceae bacterium]